MSKLKAKIRAPTSISIELRHRETVSADVGNVKGVGGVSSYNLLTDRPQLNGKTIEGDQSSLYYGITPFWFGTLAEYNALQVIDPDVCYFIEEGS